MKTSLMNKKEGSAGKIGIVLLALIAMFIALMMSLNVYGDMENKSRVNAVGRNYILKIESKGYLESTDERDLIKELESIGVTSVSTVGSTKSKVGYGEDVYLKVTGNIEINSSYNFLGFDIENKNELVKINIDEKSTGKH